MRHLILSAAFALFSAAPAFALHSHYAAGVVDLDTNGTADSGGQLRLYGVSTVPVGQPVVTAHLEARTAGQLYAGLNVLDDESPEGFSFTSKFAGDPLAAAPDAEIYARILSVSGPTGGKFGFWEAFDEDTPRILVATTPSVTFITGQPTNSYQFPVSDKIPGDPDPGGHIHHRAWTADLAGDYRVTFQLVDLSGQHPASAEYVFLFAAVPEPSTALLLGSTGLFALAFRRQR